MSSLTTHAAGPASGQADSLVIFLHGYGADGKDLLGLAQPMAQHMPNTLFLSPDAPNRCTMNPMGFEWFPIPWIDESTPEAAQKGMDDAVEKLNIWLDEIAEKHKIAPEKTVIIGFSQGTMMALHVVPRREHALACVVGFSGRLLEAEKLKAEIVTKPPVLLVHGDQDDVVPYSDMATAEKGLSAAGIDVKTHTSPQTGHGIAPDGLGRALEFILENLR